MSSKVSWVGKRHAYFSVTFWRYTFLLQGAWASLCGQLSGADFHFSHLFSAIMPQYLLITEPALQKYLFIQFNLLIQPDFHSFLPLRNIRDITFHFQAQSTKLNLQKARLGKFLGDVGIRNGAFTNLSFLKSKYFFKIGRDSYLLWFPLHLQESGREREIETSMKEKHPSANYWMPPTGDQVPNLGMCHDWEWNQQPLGEWDDAQLGHTSQAWFSFLHCSGYVVWSKGRLAKPNILLTKIILNCSASLTQKPICSISINAMPDMR